MTHFDIIQAISIANIALKAIPAVAGIIQTLSRSLKSPASPSPGYIFMSAPNKRLMFRRRGVRTIIFVCSFKVSVDALFRCEEIRHIED